MEVTARIANRRGHHEALVATNGNSQSIWIPPRESGLGSGVNGGELLFLALATCYGNDIYREAERRGIAVTSIEVEVEGKFGAAGEPAAGVIYHAKVVADASIDEILNLMRYTDTVAEIQNTLRMLTPVTLASIDARSTGARDLPGDVTMLAGDPVQRNGLIINPISQAEAKQCAASVNQQTGAQD